ncbi:hypothetical protein [Pseudomonas sp.]|uniref:hypothetical protein n=1 Tax=Pseudomonas sp. TaxID=306 RepID=UPI0028A211BE|nr:hypothetical protein [Pseudomonas sp.]
MNTTEVLNKVWSDIKNLTGLNTPDKNVPFTIHTVKNDRVVIITNGGSPIVLWRSAFEAVIQYLHENKIYGEENRVEIGSSNKEKEAKSLCVVSREHRKTRVINYILPILDKFEIVKTKKKNSKEKSSAWLNK